MNALGDVSACIPTMRLSRWEDTHPGWYSLVTDTVHFECVQQGVQKQVSLTIIWTHIYYGLVLTMGTYLVAFAVESNLKLVLE